MKRQIVPLLCLMAVLCGCTPKTDKAVAVANDFLTNFFNMNYDGAAVLCADDIAAGLRDTIAADAYPSEEIRARVVEASKNTTFSIVSSAFDEESGDVVVNYEIRPYGAVGDGTISRTMRLARLDGDWKIVALE